MKTEQEIRAEVAACEARAADPKIRQYQAVSLTTRAMALRWVLGEEEES